jgi:hypothetical protein
MHQQHLDSFNRMLRRASEQAQKHQFLNVLAELNAATGLAIRAFNDVLKKKLEGWGRGTLGPPEG